MKHSYICPACLYYDKQTVISYKYDCICDVCSSQMDSETDPIKKKLLTAFSRHSKSGYRCPDCEGFLPQSLEQSKVITCPFPDCMFSGRMDLLKKMRHPSTKLSFVPVTIVSKPARDTSPILEVIDDHINALQYTSVGCTIKQKTFVYEAFANLLKKYPEDMSSYLLEGKRGDSLQSKLFQEYVAIAEKNLPFSYKTTSGLIQVDSITHPEFNPFEGLSKFDAVVEQNQTIKNNTSELYIGNRKSYYCRPCYIGKLLDVVDMHGVSWLHAVTDYSFSVIKTNLAPGTKVQVSHLRIPAHYQVGILSHINRIKKSITDSLKS